MNDFMRELEITDTSVTGQISGIPSGLGRIFKVAVYDSLYSLQYEGHAEADLPCSSTVHFPINIRRVSSKVIINGLVIDTNDTDNSLSNMLVAWYPFSGSSRDESGYLNDGVVHGATLTTDRNNMPNRAYQFDGENDYIEVPYDSVLDCEDSISVVVWAKSDIPGTQYSGIGTIMQMGLGTESAMPLLWIMLPM